MRNLILAAQVVKENSILIKSVFDLYGLHDKKILDPTYGRGKWWSAFRPNDLTINDKALDATFDFQAMPYENESFDVVTFDPPYIPQGGRSTSSLKDFIDRFGLVDVPGTVTELRSLIRNGMVEAFRVLRPGGFLLVKSMNYVNGGQHRPQANWTFMDGIEIGFKLQTQFVHVSGVGPQPKTNRDGSVRAVKSPRANYSVLHVFLK